MNLGHGSGKYVYEIYSRSLFKDVIDPWHPAPRFGKCGSFALEYSIRMIANGKPATNVLCIAAKLLKPESGVWTLENIDTSLAIRRLNGMNNLVRM